MRVSGFFLGLLLSATFCEGVVATGCLAYLILYNLQREIQQYQRGVSHSYYC